MKKTFGQRLLSGVTSFMMAVMSVAGSVGSVPIRAADGTEAAPVFSVAPSYGTWLFPNTTYAEIQFARTDGNSVSVNADNSAVVIPDNAYYLLIDAEVNSYGNTSNNYKLIEINPETGSTSWKSGAFADIIDNQNAMWTVTNKITGTLLKNDDPSTELTLENAKNRTGCSAVNSIAGMYLGDTVTSFEKRSADSTGNAMWDVNDTAVMTASAGYTANINFYDYDETTPAPISDDMSSNFYALATLTKKGESTPVAWKLETFYPTSNAQTTMTFWDNFYAFGEDGTSKESFKYGAEEYDFHVDIYCTIGNSVWLDTYQDCQDITKASRSIPGYKFKDPEYTDNSVTFSISKSIVTYDMILNFEEPVTITESDYLYLLLTVEHQTSGITYYYQQLTADNTSQIVIPIQTKDEQHWKDGNGNDLPNERFTGNEPTVTAQLFLGEQALNLNNLTNGNNCVELTNDSSYRNFSVNYEGQTKSRETDEELGVPVASFTNTISFNTLKATKELDFKDVLGDGLYYGITADRFNQQNHAQTNLAVNYYQGNTNIDPDLTANTCGDFYIPYFVDFNGGTTVDSDSILDEDNGKINIQNSHEDNRTTLHVDSEKRLQESKSFIDISVEDPETMKNSVIEPIIAHMETVSAELAQQPAMVTPIKISDNNILIDTTAFDENATIYIDGDNLVALCPNGELKNSIKIKKKENQTYVFNFTNTETINVIGKHSIEIYDNDGNFVENNDPWTSDQSYGTPTNQWLDRLTRHMIYNLNSVKTVNLNEAAGIFLLPDEESVTTISGTSTGWVISDGYVTNLNAEWHFVYSELDEQQDKNIQLSKQTVGGAELSGAKLTLTGIDRDNKDIAFSIDQFTGGLGAKDVQLENNSITWISGTTSATVKNLADGIYTLHEDTAPAGYKTANDIVFSVSGGEIIDVEINGQNVTDNYSNNTIIMIDEDSEETGTTTTTTTSETTTSTSASTSSSTSTTT
ncbi:MAG: hypothetical protein IJ644_07815, partial [Oscillospiraceae bacterium]|nr:hypothetical protein [Oscillospiraceae bacterium]